MRAFSIFSTFAFVLSVLSARVYSVVTPVGFATSNNGSFVVFDGENLQIALQNNSFNYVPALSYVFNDYGFETFPSGWEPFTLTWSADAVNLSNSSVQIFEFNATGSSSNVGSSINVKSSIVFAGNGEVTNLYGHSGATVPSGKFAVAIQVNNAIFSNEEFRLFWLYNTKINVPTFIDYSADNANSGIHGNYLFLGNNNTEPFSFKVDSETFVTFSNGTNAKNATNLTFPIDISNPGGSEIEASLYPTAGFFQNNGSAMFLFHIEASAFMAQINFVLLAVATLAVIYVAA